MQIQTGDTLYNNGLAFNVNYVKIAEVNKIYLSVDGQQNGTIGQFTDKAIMLANADAILYSMDNIWYSGYDFKQTQQGTFIAMFY